MIGSQQYSSAMIANEENCPTTGSNNPSNELWKKQSYHHLTQQLNSTTPLQNYNYNSTTSPSSNGFKEWNWHQPVTSGPITNSYDNNMSYAQPNCMYNVPVPQPTRCADFCHKPMPTSCSSNSIRHSEPQYSVVQQQTLQCGGIKPLGSSQNSISLNHTSTGAQCIANNSPSLGQNHQLTKSPDSGVLLKNAKSALAQAIRMAGRRKISDGTQDGLAMRTCQENMVPRSHHDIMRGARSSSNRPLSQIVHQASATTTAFQQQQPTTGKTNAIKRETVVEVTRILQPHEVKQELNSDAIRESNPATTVNKSRPTYEGTQTKKDGDSTDEEQIKKASQECSRTRRPPFSYMHLILMAINSCESRRMTLKEIYTYIEDKFPYYKFTAKDGWKNSIRHNLSLHTNVFRRETEYKIKVNGRTKTKPKISFWTTEVDLKDPLPKKKPQVRKSCELLCKKTSRPPRAIVPNAPVMMVAVPPPQSGQQLILPKPSPDTATAYALIPIKDVLAMQQQAGQGQILMPATVRTPMLHSINGQGYITTQSNQTDQVVSQPVNTQPVSTRISVPVSAPLNTISSCATELNKTSTVTRLKRPASPTNCKPAKVLCSAEPQTPGLQENTCNFFSPTHGSLYTSSPQTFIHSTPVNNNSGITDYCRYDSGIEQSMDFTVNRPTGPVKRKAKRIKKPSSTTHSKENFCDNLLDLTRNETKDVGDFFSNLDFQSPLRNLPLTPPRSESLTTSTPLKCLPFSPHCSPVQPQTPLKVITPLRNILSPWRSDDRQFDSGIHTPKFDEGFLSSFLAGFTPLKSSRDPGNTSMTSLNDSIGKLLADLQFDENLNDESGTMPLDLSSLSWLNKTADIN